MTYEYLCTACGNNWEAEQPISQAALTSCPACKQETAKRQVSGGAGFILKGGGWYADLYGSTKPAAKGGEASKSSASSTTTPATTSSSTESSTTSSTSSTESSSTKPASSTANS